MTDRLNVEAKGNVGCVVVILISFAFGVVLGLAVVIPLIVKLWKWAF